MLEFERSLPMLHQSVGFDPAVGFGANPLVKENCHSSLATGLRECVCHSATALPTEYAYQFPSI